MKLFCQKKRIQETAVYFGILGVTTTAAGMLLQKPTPKISAILTGFGTANLLLSGLYYLSQQS